MYGRCQFLPLPKQSPYKSDSFLGNSILSERLEMNQFIFSLQLKKKTHRIHVQLLLGQFCHFHITLVSTYTCLDE